jgi:hypothetical protein
MHDDRFDSVAKALARGRSRRSVVAGLLGAVVTGAAIASPANAARRGFSGPFKPTPVAPESDHCTQQFECINGICCNPELNTCEGSGSTCSTDTDCPPEELCRGDACWAACYLTT